MTIKSILELQTQADTTLADNTTQLINAADVRQMFKDFLDSISPAYGGITLASKVQAVTATPTALTTFTSVVAQLAGYYIASLANGQVTRAVTSASLAGATDNVVVQGDVTAANGRVVTIELFKNGSTTGYKMTVTCGGTGKPVGFNFSGLNYTAGADAVYDVRVSGDADSYTFANVSLLCQAQPVRSYA